MEPADDPLVRERRTDGVSSCRLRGGRLTGNLASEMRLVQPLLLMSSLVAFSIVPARALAVRPFLTDDARTVGGGNAQLETWAVVDEHGAEHWVTASVGPIGPLEIAGGFVWGGSFEPDQHLEIVGPLISGKLLLRTMRAGEGPGIAIAAGALGPHEGLSPIEHAWSGFAYVALSQSFYEDDLLLHANVGFAVDEGTGTVVWLAGAGVQGRIIGPVAVVAEVFRGDSLDATNDDVTLQAGTRLLLDDAIQVDATGACVVGNDPPSWFATAGVRLVWEHIYTEPHLAGDEPGAPVIEAGSYE